MVSYPHESSYASNSGGSLHSHSYSGSHQNQHNFLHASAVKSSLSSLHGAANVGASSSAAALSVGTTADTMAAQPYSVGGGVGQESIMSSPSAHRMSVTSLAEAMGSASGASSSIIGASAYTGKAGSIGGAVSGSSPYNASQTLIASIVQRLVKRLPHNTGQALAMLEQDELMRSSVANLVNHSRFQLAVVLREVLQTLEMLNKLSQGLADDRVGLGVLQSQLFMLQVMVACLVCSWKASLEDRSAATGAANRRESTIASDSVSGAWGDPPALDEGLAKQMLGVMTIYLRQMSLREDTILAQANESRSQAPDKARGKDDEGEGSTESASLASLALLHGTGLFVLHPTFPPRRSPFDISRARAGPHPPMFIAEASQSVISPIFSNEGDPTENIPLLAQNIFRQAGQVVFFLSSSNWPVVHARIRNRLAYLSTTSEELPSTAELRLLECANYQRARLSNVLQELCSCFIHLKRPAQQTLAMVLRRMIWCWIQYYPAEYTSLLAAQRRMDGSPDILFDQVSPLAESTRKKHIYWPMLTSLLVLCPEVVNKIAAGETKKGTTLGRKGGFLDMLRKGLRNSKLSGVAALCCVDICRAAASTQKGDSGLPLIVNDIEGELQEYLFDPRKTLVYSATSIEVPLMVDTFASFFRLDPQKALRELVPFLMSDNQPIAFKIVLVKGCIQLASERDRLRAQPSISLLYPHVSYALRMTFKDLIHRMRKSETENTIKKSRFKPSPQDDTAGRKDLLFSILQLWHIDLEAAFYGMREDDATHFTQLAGGGSIFDEELVLRNTLQMDNRLSFLYVLGRAARTADLWHIHRRAGSVIDACVARELDERGTYAHAAESCMALTTDFSRHVADLLASSTTTIAQRHWLDMLQSSMRRKTTLFTAEAARNATGSKPYLPHVDEVELESQQVEKALLLTMCSVDPSACSASLQACGQLAACREQCAFFYAFPPEWTKLYAELGSLESVHTGRIAQQKRIRSCLRDAPFCSNAVVQAWREAYMRWSALTLIVARPLQDDVSTTENAQDKAAQWHNFAGFLAALGGACAIDAWPSAPLRQVGVTDREPPLQYVETFVQEMVDLLVSDSIWVREKVKETLGSDLSPRLNGILLRMIHSVLSDFFDKATGQPRPSEVYTVFVEHSITVIQMVLNRMTEANEATVNVDIGALMVLYVEYLNAITKREQAARIRTLTCQLCESIMQKKSFFAFSNEVRVRNRLFQVLCGWTTESIEETQTSDRMDRLQRDLDVVCLRTMSTLLDKLILLLPEDMPLLDETVGWAKSRQFSTYFTYFIKVLTRVKTIEEAVSNSDGQSATNTISRSREPAAGVRDTGPLKRSAILALSNLLASNIETGLHQSLPLAYQDDVQLRTAFMQIMTNVLNQGTAFDQLERISATQKPNRLIDLICEQDMQLALSICNVCKGYDDNGMDYILLNIFDSRGGIIRFLKAALHEEIERTTSEEMVFRSNTFRTHLLSAFGRTHGYEYLRTIIGPLIAEMTEKPRGYSFEIDAQKLDAGENVIVNQHRLEEMAQAFIDQICSSAHRVPAVLRELCRHIRQLMDRRFPASRYQGVGGFIFLRFINPAVVAPQIIDVDVHGASKEVRRGLLLVSKILQTLASNTLFPQHKEPFMTSLNEFLKRNVWKITTFLDQVSDTRTDPDRLAAADQPLGFGIHPFGYGLDSDDQTALHRFAYENIDKIGKDLLTRTAAAVSPTAGTLPSPAGRAPGPNSPPPSMTPSARTLESGAAVPADGKKIYDHLCIVLAELGDFKGDESVKLPALGEQGNRLALQDFVRRFQGKSVDDDAYKQLFREGPPSKAGRPVFYFTSYRMDKQTLDFEAFIYYAIQVTQKCLSQPFDLLFDCTTAQPSNMTPHQWINYFVTLAPVELAENLRTVIAYNNNTACKLWARPWRAQSERGSVQRGTTMFHAQSSLNVVVCNTVADLEVYIDRRNIALDPVTLSISTAKEEARFEQITMVWYYRALIPVTFKLSENYLQVVSLKPQTFLANTTGMLNEVFPLADIDDVRSIAMRGDDNTFFVTCRGGSASFLFISRNRSEIVQALRQARARVSRYDNPVTRTGLGRTLLPSDVPGTLLNMAMLNITARDIHLRLSAYDLLCALSSSFNFGASKARKRLLSAKGIALSSNTMGFVADLSRDFAIAAPGVTLEFLLSFFEGFERATTSQKTMCLQYMTPWLSNLVMFTHTNRDQQREYQKRVKEILSHLIAITVKEQDMYAIMQRSVWAHISKLDDLIPIVLDVFSEAAMDSGLHTERFEAVLDTMLSFTSINLRGKLLSKLRRAIGKTAQNATIAPLHESMAWKEIATLVRMNMVLSFSNKLETQLYLPELLHCTLLLAGTGENAMRYAVHGTVVNLIHSLCTEDASTRDNKVVMQSAASLTRPRKGSGSDADSLSEDKGDRTSRLEVLLHKLAEDEYLILFGLPTSLEGGGGGASSALLLDAAPNAVRDSPSNQDIAKLASTLYEIPDMAAPTVDTANAWRARLTSLVTSKAFQYNPVIQSRAFILLGCLADLTGAMLEHSRKPSTSSPPQDPDSTVTLFEVDDDLLYQILVSLRGSIQEWSSVANDAPIISIVTCLSKVVRILPDQSRYLAQMFWLGISIIQYGHIPLFKSGMDLMNATVKSICARKLPQKYSMDLISYLLDGRFDFRDAACRLDDETGVDFEINFSFGTAALMVKGLRHPSTRETTIELLQTMLRNTAVDADGKALSGEGMVSTEQLGFFIALLPTATKPDDFGHLLHLAGVPALTVAQAVEQRMLRKPLSNARFGSAARAASDSRPTDDDGEATADTIGLYSYLHPLENKIALLVVALLSALLQQSSISDAEKQLLYGFLADSAQQFPAIVSILYDYLLPNMRDVYLNSQNDEIVRAVDVIAQIAVSEPIFQLQVHETKRRGGAEAYLDESGYACLLDCGSFIPLKDARRIALAKFSATLLSGLIDAGTS